AAAAKAGYRPNPVESAVMSQMKRGRTRSWYGVIAALDLADTDRPGTASNYQRELVLGAQERGQQLGFSVQSFALGQQARSLSRMDAIFRARGIDGIMLLPSWHAPDMAALDWSRYAGIYTDYMVQRPALHSVCADHHRALVEVLERIQAAGWRRPGLFVQRHADERLQHRWTAAFEGYQRNQGHSSIVPPWRFDQFEPAAFSEWFREFGPDVVIGPRLEAADLMTAAGARVPQTHGFIALNVLPYGDRCAGLDLQPRVMGARAVELLIGHLQRNERGIPPEPLTTLVPARWVEGPTFSSRTRTR
ncbi:MAG TPA: LacI family transcriptional regulator, partial [Candidatus Synoicihabitans sp.]|nr:LacI family transcriptional regulator [Candidatus Synoicihabitans sp.]